MKRFLKSTSVVVFVLCGLLWSHLTCWANDRCGRLLLNAEAFGFGPSAASAQLFSELRPHMERMGYIGEGHTLELQESLPYDDFIGLHAAASDAQIREGLRQLSSRYSHFFTSLDFRYARIAREEGYKVGIYDPLTWFWRPFPQSVRSVDLYVAQDFAGVRETIEREHSLLPAFGVGPRPLGRGI